MKEDMENIIHHLINETNSLEETRAAIKRFKENDLGRKILDSRRRELKQVSEEAEALRERGHTEFDAIILSASSIEASLDRAEEVVADPAEFAKRITETEKALDPLHTAFRKAKAIAL